MSVAVQHISEFFDNWAPFSTQAEYDNSGLLLGSKKQKVTGIITCLDVTERVVDEAISRHCNLIVAHHPLIFRKLSRINPDNPQGALLYKLIQANIAVLAVHTNLDAAQNGVSFVLGELLGIQNPVILSHQNEARTIGFGVFGELETPMQTDIFLQHVCLQLGTTAIRFANDNKISSITKVAVCGGTGVSLAGEARKAGADAYITADIKYHEYFDAGLLLVDAGHFETESPIISHLQHLLSSQFPQTPVYSTSHSTNPMQVYLRNNL
ncbi:MAG: Nif3-like dinuclear metal center hexameric protein [Bacteroidetes bacterium]|nr:Nif3-like dinuclear metal center hexameric protein [Bacteroidota bacterium]